MTLIPAQQTPTATRGSLNRALRRTGALLAGGLLAAGLLAGQVAAEETGDPGPAAYKSALEGKRVVLVPMSMGFDLAQGWAHYIGNEVKGFGGVFETRDPNWDVAAGAQAITDLISSSNKPDVLIVQPPDLQSYTRLFKRAQEAGIFVIQVDNRTNYPTDAFVGSDWERLGELEAEAVIKGCGPDSSKKIGLIQGDQVNASSLDQYAGIAKVLKANPDFKIVGEPDSNWDATTARNVATTLLQQHPDVCGIIDFWDSTAKGTAAAIRDAGKTGNVFLVTTGGGEETDCTALEDGTFGAVVMTEVKNQSRDVSALIKFLLQSGLKPGQSKTWIYTLETAATKADVKPGTCWSLKETQAAK
ncbi:ribose transport system substrate-binding protein [Pseudoxanthobacter soli DSM 19599]|uniref:Ribose transport system substrate-binding protein n=1 Tax=Pseudoxanthobacter soli DSM 19599 TaxID=1123029 RepID=A0A1M7ZRT5_9HYPH|nr:sugar ABC transporter substrate-binding protein [Pseudoxanthobacter soli]SHO67624.1 ribose transport system substrate-binding protein [Pseudoxanthobacter soli DSM 19599]